ncbi:hypothetical protein J4050_05000 [Winogradskyella sp. DF17]|uniref:Uncharacterized protein n=1 Tax=Winogradskyella pelagia TaxID=2819984 RepID=A0ABS3T027_9FLAO|nr:DUF6090 family protein [Winogradskyella sp. DF17]MBO3116092.1 hypothetical protein [Winogradskyella sp. DF17]
MIKFFRHIRQNLLMENQTSKYFKYAIGEIILVVIGILIALQINNWNEKRKESKQETTILKSLKNDIQSDLKDLNFEIDFKKKMIIKYANCLDILTDKKEGTKADFFRDFKSILQIGGLTLNVTTFNNLQNNGELKLITNKSLADSIVGYYNTDYQGWETALRDYTRNNFAPYLLEFDYVPPHDIELIEPQLQAFLEQFSENIVDYKKAQQPLEAYKNNYMIINMLRYKSRNILGLLAAYTRQKEYAINLNNSIDDYLKKIND